MQFDIIARIQAVVFVDEERHVIRRRHQEWREPEDAAIQNRRACDLLGLNGGTLSGNPELAKRTWMPISSVRTSRSKRQSQINGLDISHRICSQIDLPRRYVERRCRIPEGGCDCSQQVADGVVGSSTNRERCRTNNCLCGIHTGNIDDITNVESGSVDACQITQQCRRSHRIQRCVTEAGCVHPSRIRSVQRHRNVSRIIQHRWLIAQNIHIIVAVRCREREAQIIGKPNKLRRRRRERVSIRRETAEQNRSTVNRNTSTASYSRTWQVPGIADPVSTGSRITNNGQVIPTSAVGSGLEIERLGHQAVAVVNNQFVVPWPQPVFLYGECRNRIRTKDLSPPRQGSLRCDLRKRRSITVPRHSRIACQDFLQAYRTVLRHREETERRRVVVSSICTSRDNYQSEIRCNVSSGIRSNGNYTIGGNRRSYVNPDIGIKNIVDGIKQILNDRCLSDCQDSQLESCTATVTKYSNLVSADKAISVRNVQAHDRH